MSLSLGAIVARRLGGRDVGLDRPPDPRRVRRRGRLGAVFVHRHAGTPTRSSTPPCSATARS